MIDNVWRMAGFDLDAFSAWFEDNDQRHKAAGQTSHAVTTVLFAHKQRCYHHHTGETFASARRRLGDLGCGGRYSGSRSLRPGSACESTEEAAQNTQRTCRSSTDRESVLENTR